MSTQPIDISWILERYERHRLEMQEHYASMRPMEQLPDKYRVSPSNETPPLLHFAIPTDAATLFKYGKKHNVSGFLSGKHLSEHVEYELKMAWPFQPTADCTILLALYHNYNMRSKILQKEDEEDVIQMVQEALGLDKSVRPKWYFDIYEEPCD